LRTGSESRSLNEQLEDEFTSKLIVIVT